MDLFIEVCRIILEFVGLVTIFELTCKHIVGSNQEAMIAFIEENVKPVGDHENGPKTSQDGSAVDALTRKYLLKESITFPRWT